MANLPGYKVSFEVRYSEVAQALTITPPALFNLMQEAAILHCTSVGQSPTEIRARGWGWFLIRFHLRVSHYPRWKERIHIHTWPHNLTGLYAIREFHVADEEGRELCRATSQWILIDLERRRPLRIPRWISEPFEVVETRQIADGFEDMPSIESADNHATFQVRLSDLDSNQHANSSSYFGWFLESVPAEVHEALAPVSVEIAYKREAKLGDIIRAETAGIASLEGEKRRFGHVLHRDHGGDVLAAGRSGWAEIEHVQ